MKLLIVVQFSSEFGSRSRARHQLLFCASFWTGSPMRAIFVSRSIPSWIVFLYYVNRNRSYPFAKATIHIANCKTNSQLRNPARNTWIKIRIL